MKNVYKKQNDDVTERIQKQNNDKNKGNHWTQV